MPTQPDRVPVYNNSGEVIPGFALMKRTGVNSDGQITVAKPDADGQFCLVNGPGIIPVDEVGLAAGYDTRQILAYDQADGTPAAGETWGAGAGTWLARKNKAGFSIDGGAGFGIVNAVRQAAASSGKIVARVAALTNGALATAYAAGQVVNGVTLDAGDPILLTAQTSGSENGPYIVNASGAPTRHPDGDTGAKLVGCLEYASEGTLAANSLWACATPATITVGSTSQTWKRIYPPGQFGRLTTASGGLWKWVALKSVAGTWSDDGVESANYEASPQTYDGTNYISAAVAGMRVRMYPGLSDPYEFMPIAPTGYLTIQEEGSNLTQRQTINLVGGGFTAVDDSGNGRTNINLDAELNAIAGLTSAADKGIYFTGSASAATYDFTSFARTLLDDADAAAALVTLGVLAFKTIVVSGQSDVVADSATDTLTLVAGTGITITTDSSTDTITISTSSTSGPAPSAPTSLTASSPAYTTVDLSWVAPSGAPPAASYKVYYSTSADMSSPTLATTTASTSYTVTGLTPGVTYYFAVFALSSFGTSSPYSNVDSDTTTAVRTAKGTASGNTGGGAVTLNVTVPSGDLLVACVVGVSTTVTYNGSPMTLSHSAAYFGVYTAAGTGAAADISVTTGGNVAIIAVSLDGLASNAVDSSGGTAGSSSAVDYATGVNIVASGLVAIETFVYSDVGGSPSFTLPSGIADGQSIAVPGGSFKIYEGHLSGSGMDGDSLRTTMNGGSHGTWEGTVTCFK